MRLLLLSLFLTSTLFAHNPGFKTQVVWESSLWGGFEYPDLSFRTEDKLFKAFRRLERQRWVLKILPRGKRPAQLGFKQPTRRFLEEHSLEDIKYNLRLDHTTFVYKDVFDKAIASEKEGFIGYHGDSREFRVFQDVIRCVLEEVVGIDIPQDFHFLAIPGLHVQKANTLQDILKFFLPEKNLGDQLKEQLFPLNCALYSNYNQIGFTSVVHFSNNLSTKNPQVWSDDLEQFFLHLGMDKSLAHQAFESGKKWLKDDRGILLQVFDASPNYNFLNQHCYPAYPNGYPFANQKLSTLHDTCFFPPEIKCLLTDAHTLNPYRSLKILRYDKQQPSVVKAYEEELRTLIQAANFDPLKVEAYRQMLLNTWSQPQ